MKKIDFVPKEGYYHLINSDDPEPVLVKGYFCTDLKGEFVFGFNTYDGGGLLPLSDLSDNSIIANVDIFVN